VALNVIDPSVSLNLVFIEMRALIRLQIGRSRQRVITAGLRSGCRRDLLATMPKTKTKKRNRVKGSASRGFFRRRKWIWIVLLVLLLIPAMQVAVVRFVDPPRTLADVDRSDVVERAKGSAPLSLDRSAANS
jgi:nitrate reductase NapE component